MAPTSNSQSGNILVYILGAIFLMGLLVVVMKGSSSPGAGIDEENLLIRVSEVQDYGNELERAVQYVLANGYSEADIRFAHPDADVAYGLITDDPERQAFAREGGGAEYREPPNGIQVVVTPWFFGGKNQVRQIGTTDGGNRSYDVIAFLSNVTREFCLSLNEAVGVVNPSDEPPQDAATSNITEEYVGVFTGGGSEISSSGSELSGRSEGCFEGGSTPAAGTYHYYRVLLAR